MSYTKNELNDFIFSDMKTVKLNYKTFGEGEPVVFLHGLFGMLDNWQTIAKKVADAGYMVYLVDQRDHGKSPNTEEFNYPVLAEDLYEFLMDEWVHQAVIIGHSMGGKTAMQFANDHSDIVKKLIVIDIVPKTYLGGHEDVFQALQSLDLPNIQDREDIYNVLKLALHDEGTVQFLMKNINRSKEGGFELKMNLPLLYESYDQILKDIRFSSPLNMPTLLVKGANSSYINNEDVEQFKKTFVESSFVEIPNAGHWVHADQPDLLVEKILEFLA